MMNIENKEELNDSKALGSSHDGNPSNAGRTTTDGNAEGEQLTPEEIAGLKEQAEKAREQMLRVAADFENFKKRAARERQDVSKYANESLLQKLIPVLDNFDMALGAANSNKQTTVQQLQEGISMISQQMRSVLAEAGLEEVEAGNKPFDPNWHEAVAQQESAEVPEGQVLQQLRKGYKLRDRLLRAATVVVAKKPGA